MLTKKTNRNKVKKICFNVSKKKEDKTSSMVLQSVGNKKLQRSKSYQPKK